MKLINHNGFRLPNIGTNITTCTSEEKQEYLRLLAIARGDHFSGNYTYYGVTKSSTPSDWYFDKLSQAEKHFPILPIQTAIIWLKIALGEITKEDWVVDIEAEKDHPRMGEFKEWYQKGDGFKYKWTSQYYGKKHGESIDPSNLQVPLITLDQFFTYFAEEKEEKEPVKGDLIDRWIELTGKPQEAPDCDMWLLCKNGDVVFSAKGDFVEIGYHSHYMIAQRPLPPPIPTKRELAEEKAREFVRKYENETTPSERSRVELLTKYIEKNS